jgi:hypothetical protein
MIMYVFSHYGLCECTNVTVAISELFKLPCFVFSLSVCIYFVPCFAHVYSIINLWAVD